MARTVTGMRVVGPALVRTPARPYAVGSAAVSLPPTFEDASKETLREFIDAYAGDDEFMEAVTLANPMVSRQALAQLDQLSTKRLRRLALTLRAYDSRWRTRATPYGLFAAVGLEGPRESEDVCAGGSETMGTRRYAQVSMGWLAPVLDGIATSQQGLSSLAFVVNGSIHEDGDHIVVERPRPGVRHARLRATTAVRAVLRACASPLSGAELPAAVATSGMSDTSQEQVRATQLALVKHGFLLSVLGADPHAVTLETIASGLTSAGVLPSVARDLAALGAAVSLHNEGGDASRADAIRAAHRAAASVARALNLPLGEESLLHVDLVLAAAPNLGDRVRREVEQVATLLGRLAPPRRADAVCHELIRRGGGLAVPVSELGSVPVEPITASPALVDAVDRCTVAGTDELVLDADLIDRIAPARGAPAGAEQPHLTDLDLAVVVTGPSPSRIRSGDFTIHVRRPAATGAGLTMARFAAGLGERGRRSADAVVEARDALQPDALHVDSTFRPAEPTAWNTSRTLLHRRTRVTTNDHRARVRDAHVSLGDLVAFPTASGPVVWDLRRDRRVVPHSVSTVDPRSGPLGAQVLELLSGDNAAVAFPWGELADREWLPRVRVGRCVLSPQQWNLPTILTGDHAGDAPWEELLRSWLATRKVPSQVVMAQGDRQLELDLTSAIDVAALRREAASCERVRLLEPLPDDAAWLPGRDGGHLVEAVYSLVPTHPKPSAPARPEVLPSRSATDAGEVPNPDVSAVTVCAPDAAHADIAAALAGHLPEASWFLTRAPERLTVSLGTPDTGVQAHLVEVVGSATHHAYPLIVQRRPRDAGFGHPVPDAEVAQAWAEADSREKAATGAVSVPDAVSALTAFGLHLRDATGADPFAHSARNRVGFSAMRGEVMAIVRSDEEGPSVVRRDSWGLAADYIASADGPTSRQVRARILLRHSAIRHLMPDAGVDLLALAATAADAVDARRRATARTLEVSA